MGCRSRRSAARGPLGGFASTALIEPSPHNPSRATRCNSGLLLLPMWAGDHDVLALAFGWRNVDAWESFNS